MSHIADLHNNGRVGLHQTIDQARGAYFQLIDKEQRAAQAAYVRSRMAQADVRCPVCSARVFTVKCHLCGYFPVDIPEWILPNRHSPSAATNVSTSGNSYSRRSASVTETNARIDKLEQMIREEQSQQREVLSQIDTLRSLLENRLRDPESSVPDGQGSSPQAQSHKQQKPQQKTKKKSSLVGPPRASVASKRAAIATYPAHNRLPVL